MAKDRFKIPTTLDVSYLDMEFNLKTKNGLGIKRPVSAKAILLSLVSMFSWFYIVTQSFIGKGGILVVIGFTIAWVVLSIMLVRVDATNRMGLQLIFSMLNYLPKSGRFVPVRLSDHVYPLQSLLNINTVDPEDGRIHYLDGQTGHVYHVVGSASALMFEQDKKHIVDKADSFYRKLHPNVEVIYDTLYEGHSVDEQLAANAETKANLSVNSKGLHALIDEQHDILKYAINNHKGLRSLHQYLIVRAQNESALIDFENLIAGDIENDGLMFRLAKTLNYGETTRFLHSLISGVQK